MDKKDLQKKVENDPYGPIIKSINDFFTQKPMKRLLDTIDEFFEQPFPLSPIPVEMYESDNELILTVDLPGIKKNQISIEYSSTYLSISVNHNEHLEKKDDKKHYYVKKQAYNHSKRTIRFPYNIDEKAIKASFKDGVLTIKMPRQKKKRLSLDE